MRNLLCTSRLIKKFPVLLIFFYTLLLLSSCASPGLKVAEYKFIYKGKSFVIRSAFSPDNPESSNKLIGANFVAVDMDQNRVMDNIVTGNTTLSEAQEIYDYCLNLLEKTQKLNEVNRENGYFEIVESRFNYKIKSFHPLRGEIFNEFIITDKRNGSSNYKITILIDHDANGILDEVLKGSILLEDANEKYLETIKTGLADKKLEKSNKNIIVK